MTIETWAHAVRRLAAGLSLALLAASAAAAQQGSAGHGFALGPYGPEGPRMREQFWLLPSGEEGAVLRATVFRPADGASADARPRPLVVINHGTSSATRVSVAMPVYYWLSKWFVDRGYVVVLPQRRGHGATGGPLVEAVGTCADPDHARSGEIAADDVEAVIGYMSGQPDIAPASTVVVGISTGGWASLALASRNPPNVRAVVNIAGGRGGHAGGRPNAVCGRDRLIEAAARYGRSARVPTLWLYAQNDSYFGPGLARAMAAAWRSGGGTADLRILPAYGDDGHDVANDHAGWTLWGGATDRFLAQPAPSEVAAAPQPQLAAAQADLEIKPADASAIETGSLRSSP